MASEGSLMMIFKKSDVMDVASEKAIFNTNPAYNSIAFDKNGFAKKSLRRLRKTHEGAGS